MPRVQAALNKAPAILVHERTAPCGLVAPTSACCRRSVDDQAALWLSGSARDDMKGCDNRRC